MHFGAVGTGRGLPRGSESKQPCTVQAAPPLPSPSPSTYSSLRLILQSQWPSHVWLLALPFSLDPLRAFPEDRV